MTSESDTEETQRLNYPASLPERVLRAGAALVGGAAQETANLMLPGWVRRSHLYQATLARMIRIIVEWVGGVEDVYPDEALSAEELTKRKAAGNAFEFASILTVGWSPLWVMAAVADITGGTRIYLRSLVSELQAAGLLAGDTTVNSVDELLDRLGETSALAADTIDIPPLTIPEMRESFRQLRDQVTALPDPEMLAGIYQGLQRVAEREQRSLLAVSTVIATGALRAGVQLGHVYLFDYYREALSTISEEGWLIYVRRVASPYVRQAARHFDPGASTLTDQLLARLERWNTERLTRREQG